MFKRGELKLAGAWSDLLNADARDAWIAGLETIDWNVFVEGPPGGQSDPKQVLKYLGILSTLATERNVPFASQWRMLMA